MKTLKKIQQRNSARILIDPKPSDDELNEIYKAALRAPDHAWLRPTKFIQVCLLYTSPSPRDGLLSRMPSSA